MIWEGPGHLVVNINISSSVARGGGRGGGYSQSWAPVTWKVAGLPLPLFGKKSSGAAAYRYSDKKVAPLPLLACKTAAPAATLKNK